MLPEGIEQRQIRAADHMPSTLRGERVDAGLVTGDRHRTRRNLARAGVAGHVELRGQSQQVGETGRESDRCDGVFRTAVECDDLGHAEFPGFRQRLQVGPAIPAIGDGDGHGVARVCWPVAGLIKLE